MRIHVVVNGEARDVEVRGLERLLDLLRGTLFLTGTKEGCGEGECGACSVLLDGRLVNSCLVPAAQCDGARILTIEGLAAEGRLQPVQEAMIRYGASQCGICIPGMVMAAHDFLGRAKAENRRPTTEDLRLSISGNICRCTGYVKIVDAVMAAFAPGKDAV